MNRSDYRLLVILAQEMNMRKAADRLFVSQPALSQRLQSIEKEWQQQLFLRSQKGVTLTPAGEVVVQMAKEILAKEESISEQLQLMDSKVYGTLKIACASIVGQNWLPKVLKSFVEANPQARISLITGWSSEILQAVYDGEVHVGIIRGTPDWKGPKMHLFQDQLYLVDKEIERLEDLNKTTRPFIQFKSDSTYYQEIQDWWNKHFKISPRQNILVDQIETCKQMALNGIGYAILPSITLTGAEGDIHKIPLQSEEDSTLKRDTWLLGYQSSFELPQVEAFSKVVQEYLDEMTIEP
ncbi:LysR family transcriptional regulator [Jeotgalibacillus proteolyticus]|uniref:LysR family transcriptional regulator n=1 Tax=Jeotgalibacillus proteolyticus TaxID=2082395 RepID=A0A2S5GH14_9BACL|nr:LysR family transcriptional regulator [Jeotgalibacillus proteolyticus]PPA72214.1 LysR family transcriptional regulator [Jeotgalibacillus proteolyticus]